MLLEQQLGHVVEGATPGEELVGGAFGDVGNGVVAGGLEAADGLVDAVGRFLAAAGEEDEVGLAAVLEVLYHHAEQKLFVVREEVGRFDAVPDVVVGIVLVGKTRHIRLGYTAADVAANADADNQHHRKRQEESHVLSHGVLRV